MVRQRGAVGAGLLLGLLVLAVVGRADEAAAVKMIEKLGGSATVDGERAGGPVKWAWLVAAPVTDRELKELKGLKHLQSLWLGGTEVTNAGLKELKELRTLKTLDLRLTKVTDAGLKELKELKRLKELYLG